MMTIITYSIKIIRYPSLKIPDSIFHLNALDHCFHIVRKWAMKPMRRKLKPFLIYSFCFWNLYFVAAANGENNLITFITELNLVDHFFSFEIFNYKISIKQMYKIYQKKKQQNLYNKIY